MYQGVFAISVAAELSGLRPQTLRVYAREGLVEPVRSAGGTRLYSGRDVTRLREIAVVADRWLNMAGSNGYWISIDEMRCLVAEVERVSTEAERSAPKSPSGRGRRHR